MFRPPKRAKGATSRSSRAAISPFLWRQQDTATAVAQPDRRDQRAGVRFGSGWVRLRQGLDRREPAAAPRETIQLLRRDLRQAE